MKILLAYPEYPDTFWSLKHALKFINKKAVMPPLGLLTIASILENGNELRLIDMNINPIQDGDILWADCVFISAMITQKNSASALIERCKNLGVKIVAGGPLFNNLYQNYPEIDHFILNEGEITIPVFLTDLKNGNPQRIYSSDKRPDINTVPIPKWDLINLNDYAKMPLQTSRGCPFDCEFCDIVRLNGREPRIKTSEQVIKELNSLYDQGWRGSMLIVDDNFIGNKATAKTLLKEMILWRKEKAFRGSFMTQVSLNIADDDELLTLMRNAGFNAVFIGLETPSKESLEECGKIHNKNRNMVEDVKKIHGFGLEVLGGLIVGFDNDDETIFERQYKFIQDAGIVIATIGILNALPGTKLYYRLKNENRLLNESTGNNTDGSLNFIPKMDKDILLKEYKNLVKTIYSAENYYQRIFNFLKEYNHYNNSKLTFNFVIAFLKSFYILGIIDKNRIYFWKLLFTTIFKYPKALSKVITQAIYYAHFEKIVELEFENNKKSNFVALH
jgi:radical SAM superfamily enzyme YgiQ (UPF0313 family)